jgi:hypothetical protein
VRTGDEQVAAPKHYSFQPVVSFFHFSCLPLSPFHSFPPYPYISLSSSVAPITLSLVLCYLSRSLNLSRSSLSLIYFFVMFLDLLFSKLELYTSGSQNHQRTTPPRFWAFQLSAATSCATIRPPEAGVCYSCANRNPSKPPLFSAFRSIFLFVFTIFLEESSSSLSLRVRARARLKPCRAELEQQSQARVELKLKLEPRSKINEPSLDSLGSSKLDSFTPFEWLQAVALGPWHATYNHS